MKKFSHTDDSGKANMVDVGSKPVQSRTAIAKGFIALQKDTLKLIKENNVAKGDVLSVARIAGIQAAKKTSELIPLCHPLLLSKVSIDFEIESDGIISISMVKCSGQTGVEMEALQAVSSSLLTIYDMCKAVDKEMKIGNIKLIKKEKL